MKSWNNQKHEEVLRRSRLKKLQSKIKLRPQYDTSDYSGNKTEESELSTITFLNQN